MGRRARALNVWLTRHGCTQVTADESHVPALPFESESFDAALLVGVLDRLTEPYMAARQLHRVLRPGGVLLVTAANDCYWRRRLDRVVGGEDSRSSSYTPASLRRLLLDAGFSLVGVEGQDGAIVRDLPLAGRFSRGHSSPLPGRRAVLPGPARVARGRVRGQALRPPSSSSGTGTVSRSLDGEPYVQVDVQPRQLRALGLIGDTAHRADPAVKRLFHPTSGRVRTL